MYANNNNNNIIANNAFIECAIKHIRTMYINILFICVGALIRTYRVCSFTRKYALIVIECCINGKIAESTNSLAFQSLFNYSQFLMAAFNLFIAICCILENI